MAISTFEHIFAMPLIPLPSDKPLVPFSEISIGTLFQYDYNFQLGYPTIHKKTSASTVQNVYPKEEPQYEMGATDLCLLISEEEFEKLQQNVE